MMGEHPQKASLEMIIKSAFRYWSKTLIFQLMFSLVFISILMLVTLYFSEKLGLMTKYQELFTKYAQDWPTYQKEAQKLAMTPEYQTFFWILNGTLVFLYPLNLGLFKIFRKVDLGEKPELADLFAGYSGVNFIRYIGYAIFWTSVYILSIQTIFLAVIWVFLTLFTAPLMFFEDKRIFETIPLNIKALKLYFVEILIAFFIAFFFKYLGILTLVGALFTLPFMNAMVYALYSLIFKSEK